MDHRINAVESGTTWWMPQRGSPSPTIASDDPAPAGRRVLIAHDDAVVLDLLAEFIALEGHDVRCAADGTSALRAVGVRRPDVVVADAELSGLDGGTLARRLREWETPIVLLGARDDVPSPAGVIPLPKPVDVERLLTLVAATSRP